MTQQKCLEIDARISLPSFDLTKAARQPRARYAAKVYANSNVLRRVTLDIGQVGGAAMIASPRLVSAAAAVLVAHGTFF